jgi:hypothetical protein
MPPDPIIGLDFRLWASSRSNPSKFSMNAVDRTGLVLLAGDDSRLVGPLPTFMTWATVSWEKPTLSAAMLVMALKAASSRCLGLILTGVVERSSVTNVVERSSLTSVVVEPARMELLSHPMGTLLGVMLPSPGVWYSAEEMVPVLVALLMF